MATTLTSPVVQPAVTHQGVTRFEIRVPHKHQNGDMGFDPNTIAARYEVTSWDSTGKPVLVQSREVPFASWPQALRNEMGALYSRLVADAKANNIIAPGVDDQIG